MQRRVAAPELQIHQSILYKRNSLTEIDQAKINTFHKQKCTIQSDVVRDFSTTPDLILLSKQQMDKREAAEEKEIAEKNRKSHESTIIRYPKTMMTRKTKAVGTRVRDKTDETNSIKRQQLSANQRYRIIKEDTNKNKFDKLRFVKLAFYQEDYKMKYSLNENVK